VFDLVIGGASILDGTGEPPSEGAVGVTGDRIALIQPGSGPPPPGARSIDATGLCLAPGFIDVHNHSDLSMFVDPWMRSSLRQGVTTVVVGNCGSSAWPRAGAPELASMIGMRRFEADWSSFHEYLEAIDRCEPAINVAVLVGHGAIRQEVLGLDPRPPDPPELDRMCELAGDAMREGALGVSSGLIYVPGIFSETSEIASVASAAGANGGIYASHIRGEGKRLFEAVSEAEDIGERAGVPVHISHLKCETSHVWGEADRLLEAVHRSVDMTADQYPYTAWNSGFASLLPPWAPLSDVDRLWRDRTTARRLAGAIELGEPGFQSSVDGVGWENIVAVTGVDAVEAGRDVAWIAQHRGVSPVEALIQITSRDPNASCIGHAMTEEDVRSILADPEVMVASDASAMSPDGPLGSAPVHPREYGTFPRVLGRYVREGSIALGAAVRKMTSLPAARFGLRDRGVIQEGAFADMVLFDPSTIDDTSTYASPHSYPTGIRAAIVAGQVAWDGRDGARAGRALRRG
jgi:N-acyl-D-amino-acid deacylase